MKTMRLPLLLTAGTLLFSTSTWADGGPHRDHRPGPHAAPWHGEIRSFHNHDFARWRGGYWHQGRHAGRLGWWWVVGGIWYFYPTPVYPYPDPYQPPVVYVEKPAPVIVTPDPVVAVPPVSQPPVQSAPPAPPQFWYYCTKPQGYYPYVPQCSTAWEKVPATPPSGSIR